MSGVVGQLSGVWVVVGPVVVVDPVIEVVVGIVVVVVGWVVVVVVVPVVVGRVMVDRVVVHQGGRKRGSVHGPDGSVGLMVVVTWARAPRASTRDRPRRMVVSSASRRRGCVMTGGIGLYPWAL